MATYQKLRNYAENAIGDIIPLDQESCRELVEYALSLPKNEAIQNHFLGILGESEVSLEFVGNFMKLKSEEDSKVTKSNANQQSKPKSSPILTSNQTSNKSGAWGSTGLKQSDSSRKGRLESNKISTTTSELLDLKPSNQLNNHQIKKSKRKNLTNLQDVEAALNDLDLVNIDPSSAVRRYCNCMATKHPLFEVAPNCLNCGKIICIKEGLQPCSYCNHELLTSKDKQEIKNILEQEKEGLIHKQENISNKTIQQEPLRKPKKITVSTTGPGSFWDAQAKALEKIEHERKLQQEKVEALQKKQQELDQQQEELKHYETIKDVDADLLKAQERLNTLLEYQATGTERTKIIDRASDYELPTSSSSNIWLSPLERALQLKKQQKQLRKYETNQASRSGRGSKVVEMVIKNGKVTMVENDRYKKDGSDPEIENDESDDEIKQLQQEVNKTKSKSEYIMSKNTWDYNQDHKKWEKPVYIQSKNSFITGASNMKDVMKSRIQFPTATDDIDLVASMPS